MNRLLLLIIVLCTLSLVFAKSNFHTITRQTNEFINLSFHFPEPQIEQQNENGQYGVASIPGLNFSQDINEPLLPYYYVNLAVPPGKIKINILSEQSDVLPFFRPIVLLDSTQETINPAEVYPALFPEQVVQMNSSGVFRDYRIVTLKVAPLQVIPEGLKFYRDLKVQVRFANQSAISWGNNVSGGKLSVGRVSQSEKEVLSKFVVNADKIELIPPAVQKSSVNQPMSLNSADPDHQVKIIVNEKGIYRVTGQDLKDAGINIDVINPQTFRLTNKGKDVHILVYGDQDQVLDPEDAVEFWGERNEKTFTDKYPDVYNDPFSDENVYWLSWGGAPGVRMVQESGAIIETNPLKFNKARYYPYTYHLEKDANFQRLGYTNTHKLSYTQDFWLFDTGIQSVGKKAYSFFLSYPDSSSFDPVTVHMKLMGKSLNPHKVEVWLNQQLVGRTNNDWYDQSVYTIDNSAGSNIWSAELKHGLNELEIQLPEMAPDGKSDYILFNWADITYSRQYKAYNNYINFTRPALSSVSFPEIDLYQFEIYNFTRSDIEVYKKGISKIVNFRLDGNSATGNSDRYKITFQDNVQTDEVEYIALTSDLKKKPLRIERDKPYDESNPTLSLKDPSNSAEYIIITHKDFYRQAQNYADYRRQEGLRVALVKTEDIYDEFNFGIKSPLAIKEFLHYAFYNWDRNHRLKYVLLLGDANYNYKTKHPTFKDFVPTFFYQTQKFGAVATDYPYSLIAGDDLIPDIFVGRVPVNTNSDVNIILEKIKEYEQETVIGPWRNQTLFMSGNDRSTLEFNTSVYNAFGLTHRPAFRTQNQRVIDHLLPKHYSSFKLNTVKDENLQYDPNFGGTTDLIEYFDNGVSFVTFLGHGGGAIWADVNLLNLQDVNRLNNKGMYPFIASMTCFTGAFDNPGNPGLAQKLLLSLDKGAIGLVASSGLGWVANDYSMLWHLGEELFLSDISVGEALAIAKITYFNEGQYAINDTLVPGLFWGHSSTRYDMIHQYNLLGDPYLHLARPAEDLQISVSSTNPLPGDTIMVTIQAPLTDAEGYLELSDLKNDVVHREPIFYSGGVYNRELTIPTDIREGTAYVRAYLASDHLDAAGYQSLGINYTVFDSVETIPAQPNAEDSVYIRFVAKNNYGLQSVKVVAIENGDTLHLAADSIGPNRFMTRRPIPPTYTLTKVSYIVYAETQQGHMHRMAFNYAVQENRPDPFIYKRQIRWTGPEKVKLGVSVGNNGSVPVQQADLKLYVGRHNFLNDTPFATLPFSLDEKDSLTLSVDFPFSLRDSVFSVYAYLNRDGESPDYNRFNNLDSSVLVVNTYQITPEAGTGYTTTENDTIHLSGGHWIYGSPGCVTQPSAITYDETAENRPLQEGLTGVPLAGNGDLKAIKIFLFNDQTQIAFPLQMQIAMDTTWLDTNNVQLAQLRLYRWDERLQAWMQENATIANNGAFLRASITQGGIYAPFITNDDKSPHIELTVDGRHIREKSLISSNPILNIMIEDESGLNISREWVEVLINDVPVPPEKIFIPDSVQQSKVLGLTVYPELSTGQFDLTVKAKDVNGNLAKQQYSLRVTDEFDLHVFGNYPNPFSDFTIFTYYLTKELDDLEIRIFTVSGRLIKVIKNDENTLTPGNDPRRIGYGELMWDGTDEDGNEVANGVYFAIIRGKYEDQEKEEILKVAKLK